MSNAARQPSDSGSKHSEEVCRSRPSPPPGCFKGEVQDLGFRVYAWGLGFGVWGGSTGIITDRVMLYGDNGQRQLL